jgi:hypothetical protein
VGKNPTDRGKQGAKRSLLVEGHGIPVGLAVEGANRNNMKLTRATLESIPADAGRPDWPSRNQVFTRFGGRFSRSSSLFLSGRLKRDMRWIMAM